MTNLKVAAGLCLALALPAAADISLSVPIDCDLGQDCYIQQYVDHLPGNKAHDFRCAPLTYNTHRGTDFALPTHQDMEKGVNVLAAAPGRVKAIRDGVADRVYEGRLGEVPGTRACGNGIVLEHDDGWTTQYCHLRRGSLRVKKGQVVKRGQALGLVGLSGRAQFPHVHLTVRKDNVVIDPFDPDGKIECGSPSTETLWDQKITYQPGGLLDAGFSDQIPEYDKVKAGTAGVSQLPPDAPAMVIFGFAFGGRAGDVLRLRIDGPSGRVVDGKATLEKTQAQLFRAYGKKRTSATWPKGTYQGQVTMTRNGKVLQTKRTRLIVR